MSTDPRHTPEVKLIVDVLKDYGGIIPDCEVKQLRDIPETQSKKHPEKDVIGLVLMKDGEEIEGNVQVKEGHRLVTEDWKPSIGEYIDVYADDEEDADTMPTIAPSENPKHNPNA